MKALYALITYVLVIAVIARQSSPLSGAVLPVGRLNVVIALLSSASRPAPGGGKAARPRGCVWLPPRSAKPPCPSRGLACRCVPPRQLGRAVGLKACLSCAVSAKPSALFAFSGRSRQPPGESSTLLPGEGAILLPGGIPPDPRTSYYYDDFHILADGNHHNNMRAKKKPPQFYRPIP